MTDVVQLANIKGALSGKLRIRLSALEVPWTLLQLKAANDALKNPDIRLKLNRTVSNKAVTS
jgi:hypothetical protein